MVLQIFHSNFDSSSSLCLEVECKLRMHIYTSYVCMPSEVVCHLGLLQIGSLGSNHLSQQLLFQSVPGHSEVDEGGLSLHLRFVVWVGQLGLRGNNRARAKYIVQCMSSHQRHMNTLPSSRGRQIPVSNNKLVSCYKSLYTHTYIHT